MHAIRWWWIRCKPAARNITSLTETSLTEKPNWRQVEIVRIIVCVEARHTIINIKIGRLLFYLLTARLPGVNHPKTLRKFSHSNTVHTQAQSYVGGWVRWGGEGYWSGQSFIGQDGDADSRRLLMEGWMEFSPHRVVVVAACWHNQGRIWQILL